MKTMYLGNETDETDVLSFLDKLKEIPGVKEYYSKNKIEEIEVGLKYGSVNIVFSGRPFKKYSVFKIKLESDSLKDFSNLCDLIEKNL